MRRLVASYSQKLSVANFYDSDTGDQNHCDLDASVNDALTFT